MDPEADQQELLERARAGEREAFDRVVAPCRRRLESFIRLHLRSKLRQRVDEDDVLQETLLRSYRSLAGFEWRGARSFFRWIATIAENVMNDLERHHLGSQKAALDREVSLETPLGGAESSSAKLGMLLAASGVSPSRGLRREERLERLEQAIQKLAPEHREVLILARIQGIPVEEVARRMGRSRGAVSMLILRALRELRQAFGQTDSLHLPQRPLEPGAGSPSSET